jgi:hypothetical protein
MAVEWVRGILCTIYKQFVPKIIGAWIKVLEFLNKLNFPVDSALDDAKTTKSKIESDQDCLSGWVVPCDNIWKPDPNSGDGTTPTATRYFSVCTNIVYVHIWCVLNDIRAGAGRATSRTWGTATSCPALPPTRARPLCQGSSSRFETVNCNYVC